ncbi:MAG: prepilin-type N-terminal cleavage/methylation domain-containing protein [Candidatus Eisenbacteria bacterium]|nr:prepilin-type N-terminal cleavage/methylation domain-containing protein [Candidatus Latescibacterota bacterium]MBD3302655.1 prepilin-type N-terminal cleavage/methylation domain-containing protein [Candidatus Eisenbacteria bacterium]
MNTKRRSVERHGRAGFTLVELLVAVTILAIGILSVGQILAFASRNTSFGRTETIAVSLAREIQEKILSEAVDQVPMVFDGVDTAVPGSITTPCQVWADHLSAQLPNGRGTIDVLSADQDPELLNGMFRVQVNIFWKASGDTVRLPLQFAITDIGGG